MGFLLPCPCVSASNEDLVLLLGSPCVSGFNSTTPDQHMGKWRCDGLEGNAEEGKSQKKCLKPGADPIPWITLGGVIGICRGLPAGTSSLVLLFPCRCRELRDGIPASRRCRQIECLSIYKGKASNSCYNFSPSPLGNVCVLATTFSY